MRGEMFKAIETVLSSKHGVEVDASAHHSIGFADTLVLPGELEKRGKFTSTYTQSRHFFALSKKRERF